MASDCGEKSDQDNDSLKVDISGEFSDMEMEQKRELGSKQQEIPASEVPEKLPRKEARAKKEPEVLSNQVLNQQKMIDDFFRQLELREEQESKKIESAHVKQTTSISY